MDCGLLQHQFGKSLLPVATCLCLFFFFLWAGRGEKGAHFSTRPPVSHHIQQPHTLLFTIMAVPWLITDARFPHFRNDVDTDETWGDGLKENGHVVPGIINVGDLLGTSAFEVVSLREPELRAHPITGADAIVTILYQHRPSLLRQFLDASDFTYVHSFDKHLFEANPVPRMHFVISRRGDDLTVGACL